MKNTNIAAAIVSIVSIIILVFNNEFLKVNARIVLI